MTAADHTLRGLNSPSGITNGALEFFLKYSLALFAFSPSLRKSNSWGRERSISRDSHSRSYSGKNRLSAAKVIRVRARSRGTHSARAGCCTLTATFCPVSFSVAICTCAREAAPIGADSKDENNSSMLFPVSATNMASTDSMEETGHLSCSGMNVVVHSSGKRYPILLRCWPSLMKIDPFFSSTRKVRSAQRLWQARSNSLPSSGEDADAFWLRVVR